MKIDVATFFSQGYERELNSKMKYRYYSFPYEEFYDYLDGVLAVEIKDICRYITSQSRISVTSADLFQFSNFINGTTQICQLVKDLGDPGLNVLDLGKLLLNDGQERKKAAYTKYGENHVKLATSLGLFHEITGYYFLTCVGFVFNDLDVNSRERLLVRTILRSPFVRLVLQCVHDGVYDCREMIQGILSETTYVRRRGNFRAVLNKLVDSKEYDFSPIVGSIVF